MRYRILVVDDEWSRRSNSYDNLSEEISRSCYCNISFDYLEDGSRAAFRAKLNQGAYSAVISDAILNGNREWRNFTIRDVVDVIRNFNDKLPMAVLSSRWGDDNISEVRHAWLLPNCRTFLHWRDIGIDDNGNVTGDIRYAVESIYHMVADDRGLDTDFRLDPDDDLRIVHISDLHVQSLGPEENDDTIERIHNYARVCARAIQRHWDNKKPSFIAFTGDVTEYGDPRQYELALEWIKYFCAQLNFGSLPSKRLLYVPGNHDVNLRLAAASRIELAISDNNINPTIGDSENQSLIPYASIPFRNYLSKLADCPLLFNDIDARKFAWLETRFRHYGIIFYGVNTSEPSSSTLPMRKVDIEIIRRLGDGLREILPGTDDASIEAQPIVFGLGHHSPLPVHSSDGAVENTRDMKAFFQGTEKTHVFLYGHNHEAMIEDRALDSSRIIMSGAPTFNSEDRPNDTFRGFNLLTLTRKNNSIDKLKIDSFGWLNYRINLFDSKEYILRGTSFEAL